MENLKELRLSNKKYQKDIAKILNIAVSTYCGWEKGVTEPNIESLKKLADYFGCTVDYIIGREGEDGTFYIMGNELSKDETELVDKLRQLNPLKKEVVYQIVDVLTEQQRQGK